MSKINILGFNVHTDGLLPTKTKIQNLKSFLYLKDSKS